MIFIDENVGSKELLPLIDDAVIVALEFGDIMFTGNGRDGKIRIGVERKCIGDLINSISTGRIQGFQIPGMLTMYNKCYLIGEGLWRESITDGVIEVFMHGKFKKLGSSKFSANRLNGYLIELNEILHVCYIPTIDMADTARVVQELYHWWNKKWEAHKGYEKMYKRNLPPSLMPGKASLLRRVAIELSGIGDKTLQDVEKKFNTVYEMVNASIEDWMEVGRLGKLSATKIYNEIRGNNND